MTDVGTAKDLIRIGDIINIIFAAIAAFVLLITIIGILFVWIPILIGIWTHSRVQEAMKLIDAGKFNEAKDKIIVPAVVSLIFNGLLGGLFILIGAIMLPSENKNTTEAPQVIS
ncbi:hypothetical protein [Thermococcus zilligii]|uniref:hypothetical protein n=1 Tax=Thermococcus zilligii TaxID=54076 RepID=UPI00029B25C8|nr:hypothetical protein [Thermococcus zilligii]